MTKMLEDLATIIALDGPKGNYSVACTAALGYFRTHHAEIAQNAEAAKRLEAADALLREAVEWNWLDDWVSDMHELDGRIQAHLQESGE